MDRSTVVLLVCVFYLALTLLVGVLSGRKASKSVAGFVAGDRSFNTLILYFVLGASVFSAFAFLGGPGWSFSRGAAAFYILAYGVIGMVPLYFIGPRTRRLGEKLGFVTQAELLLHRYNSPGLSVLMAVLSTIVFIPYLTLQMVGAGKILFVISEGAIPEWIGALVPYLIVMTYVFTSGVIGVGWTNAFQGMFMMGIAWFLGLYLPFKLYGGVGPMFDAIRDAGLSQMLEAPGLDSSGQPWNWWSYSSAVIVSALGLSMWPHLFMKCFTARSDRSLRLTVVLYPTFQLFLVPILLVGMAAILLFPEGLAENDTVVPALLMRGDIGLPAWVVGLVCAGTLAASMSSGDAILHAGASIAIHDGVKRVRRGLSEVNEQRLMRALVIALTLISYYFAVVSEVEIVQLLLGSYGGVAQIFPLIFAAFYWPRATGKGAIAGLAAGLIVNTLFLMAPELKPVPLHEGVYGLIANIAVLATVSLLTEPEPEETLSPYFDA